MIYLVFAGAFAATVRMSHVQRAYSQAAASKRVCEIGEAILAYEAKDGAQIDIDTVTYATTSGNIFGVCPTLITHAPSGVTLETREAIATAGGPIGLRIGVPVNNIGSDTVTVTTVYQCGYLCGGVYELTLNKVGGRWRVIGDHTKMRF